MLPLNVIFHASWRPPGAQSRRRGVLGTLGGLLGTENLVLVSVDVMLFVFVLVFVLVYVSSRIVLYFVVLDCIVLNYKILPHNLLYFFCTKAK